MEVVQNMDKHKAGAAADASQSTLRKVLVIDDSVMLISFVKEVLSESNYEVATATSGEEGLAAAANEQPNLILLDYVLPDMRGDALAERLRADEATSGIPIVYMPGFGSDLKPEQISGNVTGSLNKPFTSDLLTRTVEQHISANVPRAAMPAPEPEIRAEEKNEPAAVVEEVHEPPAPPENAEIESESVSEPTEIAAAAGGTSEPWWSTPVTPTTWPESPAVSEPMPPQPEPAVEPAVSFAEPFAPELAQEPETIAAESQVVPQTEPAAAPQPLPVTGNIFFGGDSTFFSLYSALQTIGREKLTGVLRCSWDKEPLELLARNGGIALVTTRDPQLYCPEAPITLVNVDAAQTEAARAEQRETGCPLFLALTRQELIVREPAMQLVQHYGQKLFAQLFATERVRFVFELTELPEYAHDVPADDETDQWALSTLRFLQIHELSDTPKTEPNRIPAYTCDGYERVQQLRLTVAEAQFASQFNGVRSTAQIAKNLRLDLKFARLTLFRFLALEIIECWPPTPQAKQERRGFFQRIGSAVGLGD